MNTPLTSPGTTPLQMNESAPAQGVFSRALLLVVLVVVGALVGAGLLMAGLAFRGDLVTLTSETAAVPVVERPVSAGLFPAMGPGERRSGDDELRAIRQMLARNAGPQHFWTSPLAALGGALLLAVVAVSVWVRVLAARADGHDIGQYAAMDAAAEEARERELAPLRDLSATLSRLVHDAAATLHAASAGSAEAVAALRNGVGAVPGQATGSGVPVGEMLDALQCANHQAERLERAIPELMLMVARLSQAEILRSGTTATRLDIAMAELDRSAAAIGVQAGALAQAAQDGQQVILALERGADRLDVQATLIASSTEQAGVMIASLPEAASLVHAAAARLTQDGAGVGIVLERGTAVIDGLTNAAALVHASAARLVREGGTMLDGLQKGAADFATEAASLTLSHQQATVMLAALPEATLLVHAAADRLAEDVASLGADLRAGSEALAVSLSALLSEAAGRQQAMSDALSQAASVVQVVVDRLSADEAGGGRVLAGLTYMVARGTALVELAEADLQGWSGRILALLQAFRQGDGGAQALLAVDMAGEIDRLLAEAGDLAGAMADGLGADAPLPSTLDASALLGSLQHTIGQLQAVAEELALANQRRNAA
jgi:hypothetical protein